VRAEVEVVDPEEPAKNVFVLADPITVSSLGLTDG
jgi:hypothetical protein